MVFRFCWSWIVFSLLCAEVSAQTSLNEKIVQTAFAVPVQQNNHRKALELKDKSILVKINPLTYVGVGLLYFYQNVVSEQFSADCTYQRSCSENAKKAIERYGLIKGVWLGAQQLNACFPGVRTEHADHAVRQNGKVYINLEDYD